MLISKSIVAAYATLMLLLLIAEELGAGDHSQLGFSSSRNNVAPASDVPANWTESPRVRWERGLGSQTNGSPVVASGKVFIGTNNGGGYLSRFPKEVDLGILLCIDETTGGLMWQYCCEKLPTGKVHDWPEAGICSTPLVEEDRLWFVSNRGEVVCLDTEGFRDGQNDGPETGEEFAGNQEADVVWSLDMMRELGVQQHNMANCSITAVGDCLLVCTSNGVDLTHQQIAAPDAPSFVGLDKRTGHVIWRDSSPGANILHGQWSSPAVLVTDEVSQAIFAGGDGWLYSFDPLGDGQGRAKLLWKFDCNPKKSRWIDRQRGRRNNLIAMPVVDKHHVYIATGRDPEKPAGVGRLWCIDAAMRLNGSDVSEELAFGPDGNLLAHRRIQAVDRSRGETSRANPASAAKWCYLGNDQNQDGKLDDGERMHRTMSNVATTEGLLIATDIAGIVHCLDAVSGRPHWTYDMFAEIWASPLIVGKRVIIVDGAGQVSMFQLAADRQVATREVDGKASPHVQWTLDSAIQATPTVSQGVLYVATQRKLYALDLCREDSQNEAAPPVLAR